MIKKTLKKGMVIALTAVMMSTSAAGTLQGMTKSVFANESARQMAASVRTKAEVAVPEADILNVTIKDGKVSDQLNHKLTIYNEPKVIQDQELGRTVMSVGAKDGVGFMLSKAEWTKLGDHYSFECMVKEHPDNSHARYGTGLMGPKDQVVGSGLFYENNGTKDGLDFYGIMPGKTTTDLISPSTKEKWMHVVGSYDGNTLKLYINGKRVATSAATNHAYKFTGTKDAEFSVGHTVQGMVNGASADIAVAKVYGRTLTDAEIQTVYQHAEKTDILLSDDANFVVAEGDTYTVPKAETKTATGNPGGDVSITVTDPKGAEVQVDEKNQFTPDQQGEYKILYTVAGATLEKTLRVAGIPSVESQKMVAAGDESRTEIKCLDKSAKVKYTSTNAAVAGVDDNGTIHAKKAGETTIQIQVDQAGHTYALSSEIKVVNKPSVIKSKVMTEGDHYGIIVESKEKDAKVVYSSTNSSVASVDTNGNVQARKAGIAVIRTTVKQNGNIYSLNTNITVKAKLIVKPTIDIIRKTVLANSGFRISVGHKVSGSKVNFKTSNSKIASVSSSGYVKGLRAGKTTIVTAVRQNGSVYTFKTNVTVNGFVKFIKVKKTIKRKKSYTFKAKAYGTGTSLKWSVSNKKLAKISKSGKFTAKKKKGKVYVTAKSGKYSKKILITIK